MFTVEECRKFQDATMEKARARLKFLGHLSPVTMVLTQPEEAEKLKSALGLAELNPRRQGHKIAAIVVDMNADWDLKLDYIRYVWPENNDKLDLMLAGARKRFGPDTKDFNLAKVACKAIYNLAGFTDDKDLYAEMIAALAKNANAFGTLLVSEAWCVTNASTPGLTPKEELEAAGVKDGNVEAAPGSYEGLVTMLQMHTHARMVRQAILRAPHAKRGSGKVTGFGELEDYSADDDTWGVGRFANLLRPLDA